DLAQAQAMARGAISRARPRFRTASGRLTGAARLSALTPEELDISAAATEFLAAVLPTPSWAAATAAGNIDAGTSAMYDSGSRAALATLERTDIEAPAQDSWVSVIYD